ncbi:uncharacterized protein LOC132193040 [Neocloeon triangulifer]|uniref:uncharacterized protein LOC132193040 n=1 Tax=Neocloeon triangulifer TaxID=2078957 RepID=UPI00286F55B1|nr:uncharacterized protein LOC132193040 [Neocloeon triangulifer]
MGPSVAAALLMLAAGLAAAESAAANMPAVCTEEPGCKCTRMANGFWVQVACSCTPGQDLLEIKPEQLPLELLTLEISRCKEVRLLQGALSLQRALRKIHARDVGSLTLKKNSFLNATATNTLLLVENCSTVVIESGAYKNTLTPQSMYLEKANHVVIQPSAFSWIQDFQFKKVARLELHKNAFSQSGAAIGHHGPATKVTIEDSLIPEIPGLAFPLSAAELRIHRSGVSAIRRDAFSGLLVLNLSIEHCNLHTVESGAFSPRTLVHRLNFNNLTIDTVHSNAVQSAIANFTLQNTKIGEIREGGVNVTAATVTLVSNTFYRLHSRGLAFSQWDRLEVVNNTFRNMGFSGVWAPSERNDGTVVFIDNTIGQMSPERGVLYFGISPRSNSLDVQVQDNRFQRDCVCSDWLREEVSPRRGEPLPSDYAHRSTDFWVEAFKNSSYCVVRDVLSRCFGSNTTSSFMRTSSYSDRVCSARTAIQCQNGEVVDIPDPTTSKDITVFQLAWPLLGVAMLGVLIIVIINAMVRCYRQYPGDRLSASKIFPCLRRREVVDVETPTLPIGTVVSNSIDLLPGPRKQKRKKRHKRRNVGVTASEDNTLIMDEVTPGSESGTVRTTASTLDSEIEVADHGTQTVGTGTLVDDILSDLKEKLKDPKAYGETREMIENIYNQITTESNLRPAIAENTYAEIQPSTSSSQSPVVCEYVDPRDRRNNIYTEPQTRLGRIYNFVMGHSQNNEVLEARPAALTEYMSPSDARINVYTEVQQPSRIQNRPLPRTPEEDLSDSSEGETGESDDDESS